MFMFGNYYFFIIKLDCFLRLRRISSNENVHQTDKCRIKKFQLSLIIRNTKIHVTLNSNWRHIPCGISVTFPSLCECRVCVCRSYTYVTHLIQPSPFDANKYNERHTDTHQCVCARDEIVNEWLTERSVRWPSSVSAFIYCEMLTT